MLQNGYMVSKKISNLRWWNQRSLYQSGASLKKGKISFSEGDRNRMKEKLSIQQRQDDKEFSVSDNIVNV